jgi:hypothetical protein
VNMPLSLRFLGMDSRLRGNDRRLFLNKRWNVVFAAEVFDENVMICQSKCIKFTSLDKAQRNPTINYG